MGSDAHPGDVTSGAHDASVYSFSAVWPCANALTRAAPIELL